MANMTLALPEELHRKMRKHPEIRWAEVVRRAIAREVDRLAVYDRLLSGSKMSEEEAVRLGRRISKAAAERLP
jgi:hypothetical protein